MKNEYLKFMLKAIVLFGIIITVIPLIIISYSILEDGYEGSMLDHIIND